MLLEGLKKGKNKMIETRKEYEQELKRARDYVYSEDCPNSEAMFNALILDLNKYELDNMLVKDKK